MDEFQGPDSFQLDVPSADRYAGQRRAPEDNPLPNALRALAELLGQQSDTVTWEGWTIDQRHMRLMGYSGIAFDLWWPPIEAQLGCADAALEMRIWRDELLLGGASLGYDIEVLVEEAPRFPRALGSLLQGWPLVLLGQPEPHQMVLVTGYEDNGHTLLGYLAEPGGRGIAFAPEQRLHLHGGLTKATALGLVTDWQTPPPLPDLLRDGLRRGAALLARTSRDGYLTGQALFAAWAEALESGEPALVHQAFLGDPLIWELAERRWYGSLYLRLASEHLTEHGTALLAAAACFQAEHDLMYVFNSAAGGTHPGSPLPLLTDAATRPKLAGIVRQAAAQDAEAARLLAGISARSRSSARP